MSKSKKNDLDILAEYLAAHIIVNAPSGLFLEGLSRMLITSKRLHGLSRDDGKLRSCLEIAAQRGFIEMKDSASGIFISIPADVLDDCVDEEDEPEEILDEADVCSNDRTYSTSGLLRITPNGYGFVSRRVGDDILIPQAALGGAITGDQVRIDVFCEDGFESTGEVTHILSFANNEYVGILSAPEKPTGMHRLQPFMSSLCGRGILVRQHHSEDLTGSLVRVVIEKRPDRPGKPVVCRVVDYCASPAEQANTAKAICVEFGLSDGQSEAVTQEAEKLAGDKISSCQEVRRDLTSLPFITIDGDDSRDFDDAVYAESSEIGWNIKVAIADVSFFVTPGSVLDVHAYERATSIYFPDQCIPMLPEELSNGICSLIEGENRLVLVADMAVSADGEVVEYEFYRSTISSQKRLTYRQAERMLDKPDGSKISEMLCTMDACRVALNRTRIANGALIFPVDESCTEDEDPGVYRKSLPSDVRLKSQKLIEELMLAANQSAAKFLSANLGQEPVLLRTHDAPDEPAVIELAKFANIDFCGKTPRQILQEITTMRKSYASAIFVNKALRCMKKAVYSAVTGGCGQDHFSLATAYYTHFTSPIRRYPDILVHRDIIRILEAKQVADSSHLGELARHCSDKEQSAAKAERAYKKRESARSAIGLVGQPATGIVSGLSKKGIYVEIGAEKLEGFIPSKHLRGRFDRASCTYHLYRTKELNSSPRVLRLGAPVDVEIIGVSEMFRSITLNLRSA